MPIRSELARNWARVCSGLVKRWEGRARVLAGAEKHLALAEGNQVAAGQYALSSQQALHFKEQLLTSAPALPPRGLGREQLTVAKRMLRDLSTSDLATIAKRAWWAGDFETAKSAWAEAARRLQTSREAAGLLREMSGLAGDATEIAAAGAILHKRAQRNQSMGLYHQALQFFQEAVMWCEAGSGNEARKQALALRRALPKDALFTPERSRLKAFIARLGPASTPAVARPGQVEIVLRPHRSPAIARRVEF